MTDWEKHWQEGKTGWDAGKPVPALKNALKRGDFKSLPIPNIGQLGRYYCGRLFYIYISQGYKTISI